MKPLKTFFVLFFFFSLANICHAQKIQVALVNVKLLYASENGITQLVTALKSVNSSYPTLTAEEKDKEFNRFTKKCRDSKNKDVKSLTTLNKEENAVCVAINGIYGFVEEFKKKHEYLILLEANDCDRMEKADVCSNGVDVTKQFNEEYDSAMR